MDLRRVSGPREWLVVASQAYLVVGFLWFAADHWAGPNDEAIRLNLFALGWALGLVVALALWVAGRTWPARVLNALLAIGLAYFLVVQLAYPFWGSTGIGLAASGLFASLYAVILGGRRANPEPVD